MKRRYKQNLLEIFYIVTNSFTVIFRQRFSHEKKYYEKLLRTVILFSENIYFIIVKGKVF